jgi:choline/glycine/proline betaine transport protein
MQTAAIIAALPFSLVMIIMMWGLVKALHQEGLSAPAVIADTNALLVMTQEPIDTEVAISEAT